MDRFTAMRAIDEREAEDRRSAKEKARELLDTHRGGPRTAA